MLVCKSRGTVDQNLNFNDPPDEVEVTDGRIQRADQVDGHASGGLFPFFSCEISSKVALPGLAVPLGDVAGHKHECPNARKWYERRDRLRQSRQPDLQPRQCLVYRKTVLHQQKFTSAARASKLPMIMSASRYYVQIQFSLIWTSTVEQERQRCYELMTDFTSL